MQERLKEIPKKLLEYWNKWTKKQRTIIISAVAAVILLVAVLVAVLGRTKYVELYTYSDTKTASSVISLLKENSISTKLASDNVTVMVDEKRYSEAIMSVASSDVANSSFGIDGLLDTSITTTNGERLIRQHIQLKEELMSGILATTGVVSATLTYLPKDTSNRIITSNQSIPASIALVTDAQFKKTSAEAIAKFVSFALGNTNTDLIRIIDQNGNVLFDGNEENTDELDYGDKVAVMEYFRDLYVEAVSGMMLMNGYTQVDVSPYLDVNFDKVEKMLEEYFPYADGEDRGLLVESHSTSSSGTNGSGDIPGTASNDETDYYITTSLGGDYKASTQDMYYQPSKQVTTTLYDTGTLSAENSSITVTARRVRERTQEELELLGLLDNTTFEEYVVTHSDQVQTDTGMTLVEGISMATGIPTANIRLITYDVYEYIPKVVAERNWTFYLQILLAVLLVAFLIFVLFRGTAPVEVTEVEPELSVEQLLATTKENQSLEDVEFSEQSETRRMIEKFFDENPEAVAQLLRNWLNEDWE